MIARNRARKGKTLWTTRDDGAALRLILSGDEQAEGERLAREALKQREKGRKPADVCVLFRTNAQSRALEIAFRRLGVPYDLVGGVSFYERKEVKDVLAYLRAALNPRDSVSFLRILNTPRRGLGDRVRAKLEERVTAGELPGDALAALAEAGALSAGSTLKARALLDLLDEIRERSDEPADRLLEETLRRTEYLAYLDEAHPADAAERRENLEELLVAARQFAEQGSGEESGGSLVLFLTEAALVADVDRWAEDDDRVALITMHNAKGLEFPVVILAGLEEGLLPHGSALEDDHELEEERRLFYVGLTRAEDEVILSAASFRRRYDRPGASELSRFVREIPSPLLVVENPVRGSTARRVRRVRAAPLRAPSARVTPAFVGTPNPRDDPWASASSTTSSAAAAWWPPRARARTSGS